MIIENPTFTLKSSWFRYKFTFPIKGICLLTTKPNPTLIKGLYPYQYQAFCENDTIVIPRVTNEETISVECTFEILLVCKS